LDWQIDNEIKELEQRLSASILELETLLQTRKAQLEFGRDRRKARIARAHASAKKRRLKLLESREGRQINEVQQELLQTSRNRDAQLEFADQTHADNQDALAREEQALASLERRTRSAFRGYAAFRRLLESTPASAGLVPAADLEALRVLLAKTARDLRRLRMSPLPLLFRLL